MSSAKRFSAWWWYGLSMAVLLILLRWLELRFLVIHHSMEIYIGLIALLFTGLGIWLALRLMKPDREVVVVEKKVLQEKPFFRDEEKIARLGLSAREIEILQLMAEGKSNQEMADCTFVSLNTIKTHNSNIFSKLDVTRRTQAIQKARELGILA